eukprot:PITA_36400
MILLSWNCRGLASKPKKLALKELISRYNPDILFLQETLGKSLEVESALRISFLGWTFHALDAEGHSGGLAIGFREGRLQTYSLWGMAHVIGLEAFSPKIGFPILFLNVYGPCQGRESFWNLFLSKSLLKNRSLILGGDLNFSMGNVEAWGPFAREDPLSEFFANTLQAHNLIDVNLIKVKPTWRNRRAVEGRVAKRLDHFLISEDMIANIPMFRQWVGEGGNSDHFPILMELQKPPLKPAPPFKFNASWLQEESFNILFKEYWRHPNSSVVQNKGALFMDNLKRLKKATIEWAKARKISQNEELSKIDADLRAMEDPEAEGYVNQESKDKILLLEKQRNKILLDKEEEWRLKSRAIWLKAGDENTKFFHNYAKGRKNENTIWKLKDRDGREATSFEELSSLGKNHFQSLFSDQGGITLAEVIRVAQCFPRFVEDEEDGNLVEEVTKEEVEAVVKSMAKDKIPGPDGWTIELFNHFFDEIGDELTGVVEESRRKGEIYSPFNATFITLIPKKEDPVSFEDFRPISLCNCVYKIIAKIIVVRLKPVLSRNISSEQFSFLDGRQIHEAIGVAQETIHSLRQSIKKGAVIKIDLSKAYDRISWTYLRMLLTHLGFKLEFINWVMGCVSSVSFAVLINGASSHFFKGQRGLRQGCPLSSLLFLLVAEGLSRLILEARRTGLIKGLEVAVNMFISHLLFVDDILLFTNGNLNELRELKIIFDLFMKATGMQINFNKSQLIMEGFSRLECAKISAILPFEAINMETPFKYLGFWLKPNSYKNRIGTGWWPKLKQRSTTGASGGYLGQVGNGENVRIGRDPWVGCNELFALSPGLLRHLDSKGIVHLYQVEKIGQSTIWGQAWKSGEDLKISPLWWNEWQIFIQELERSNVRIRDRPDQLVWAHADSGSYVPKAGYSFLTSKKGWEDPSWWAKTLWKLKCPKKARLFFWCVLKQKIPTWDVLQARFKQGPGRCSLCKDDSETIPHLFLGCPFTKRVWKEVTNLLKKHLRWEGESVLAIWEQWWNHSSEENLRNLPPIVCWGVWLERNKCLFKDNVPSAEATTIQSTVVYSSIPEPENTRNKPQSKEEPIKAGVPWAYFDGASQINSAGAGIIIHLNDSHSLMASVGLGTGSNNYAELSALKLLLCWLVHRHIFAIQIFGDSLNVVKWVNGNSRCQTICSGPSLKRSCL